MYDRGAWFLKVIMSSSRALCCLLAKKQKKIKVRSDHRSKFSNLSNWKEEGWKNQGFNGTRTRDLREYRCDALPTELWSHTLGARSIYWVHIFPCSEVMWSIYEIIHICTAVVDEVKSDHRSKFSNLSNWKEEAWKNQGFNEIRTRDLREYRCDALPTELWATHEQLSHTLGARSIYWVHFFPCSEVKYELNKLTSLPMCGFIAQLVEHRTGIRGGHGFESRWSPDFFRLLLSNCLNWKIYCDDHSSLHLQPQYKYELFHIYFTKKKLLQFFPFNV